MLLFAPVILFTPPRLQVLIAAAFAAMVLTYPMLRGAGLVPTDAIHSLAQSVSEQRAGSLKYRFDHEDALLARANEKPFAGWGSWGRNRIYDPETGRDLSVTDGLWVITVGSYGWFGYLAQFGMLTVPILMILRRANQTPATTAGLALVLAANLVYLIPNSALAPTGWLAAGAIAGTLALHRRSDPSSATRINTQDNASPRWTTAGPAGPLLPAQPGVLSSGHRRRTRS